MSEGKLCATINEWIRKRCVAEGANLDNGCLFVAYGHQGAGNKSAIQRSAWASINDHHRPLAWPISAARLLKLTVLQHTQFWREGYEFQSFDEISKTSDG